MIDRIKSLDGVRGLAISMVMISHLLFIPNYDNTAIWKFLKNGWMGVDLFFALSGFLITSILLNSKKKENYFKNFLIRRTLRIFPLYYFVLLIVLIGLVFSTNADFGNFLWYITYTSNIGMAIQDGWLQVGGSLGLSHFWSLAVEEQFYIFWPFIIYYTPNRLIPYLALLILIMGPASRYIIGELMHSESMAGYVMTVARMDSLAGGALLASVTREKLFSEQFNVGKISWPLHILGLALCFIGFNSWSVKTMYFGLASLCISSLIDLKNKYLAWSGLIITGIMVISYYYSMNIFFFVLLIHIVCNHRNKLTEIIFENSFILHLGKYSYALYIFHHLLQEQWKWLTIDFWKLNSLHPILFQFIFVLISSSLTYLIARITWKFIEKPFQDLKAKFEFK